MEFIVGGIAAIVFGIMVLHDPLISHSAFNYTWDFTSVRYPLGFGAILFGAFEIYIEIRKRRREKNTESSDDQTTEE